MNDTPSNTSLNRDLSLIMNSTSLINFSLNYSLDISLICIIAYMFIIIILDHSGNFNGFKNTNTILRLCRHTTICGILLPILIILNLFYSRLEFTKLVLILACTLYAYCLTLSYNCIVYASDILRKFRDECKTPEEFTNLKLVLQTGCDFLKNGLLVSIGLTFIIIVGKFIIYLIY